MYVFDIQQVLALRLRSIPMAIGFGSAGNAKAILISRFSAAIGAPGHNVQSETRAAGEKARSRCHRGQTF